MASFSLKIITPKGTVLEETVAFIRVAGQSGEIGVAPNHSATLAILKPGECYVRFADETEKFYFIPQGWIHITEESVTLLVDYLELASEIDHNRAKEAKERAEKRLADQEDNPCDESRARAAITKADVRIDIVSTRR